MKKEMTLGEMFKRKDFICSTNVERTLLDMLIKCGFPKQDVAVDCKYDKEMGDAKERIYKEFSKMLGFKYFWEGFYHLEENEK